TLRPRRYLLSGVSHRYLDDAAGHIAILALRQHQRLRDWLRRRLTDSDDAVEQRRSQLHDLHHGRHTGRGLRLDAPVEYRHRARGDRRWRWLYLFEPAAWRAVLGRARVPLQFPQSMDAVSERRRHAFRLGRVAILDQAVSGRTGRLCLPRGRLRQRLRRSGRLLPVARGWCRAATRIHHSPDDHDTGVPQSQKLLGIRQPEPARRMERLGHIRNLTGGTDAERLAETNDHEII